VAEDGIERNGTLRLFTTLGLRRQNPRIASIGGLLIIFSTPKSQEAEGAHCRVEGVAESYSPIQNEGGGTLYDVTRHIFFEALPGPKSKS